MNDSLLLSWVVVIVMAVRVCVVDKCGPGRTKVIGVFPVGSFVGFNGFYDESWKVLGCLGKNLNRIKINAVKRVVISVVYHG